MHSTSTNVLGRINARMIPTATQNRANPMIRFKLLPPAGLFYHSMPQAPGRLLLFQDVHHILLAHSLFLFGAKLIHHIRDHIQDLGHGILILDVHQTGLVILDHQDRAGRHLTADTAGPFLLLICVEGARPHGERHIHQGKD